MIREYDNVEGYKVKLESYTSSHALMQDLQTRPMKSGGWHEPEFSEWSGMKSREELNEMLENGYDAPVKKLKDKMKITVASSGKRISFRNNIVGGNPIVPLAMMGIPNSMIDMHMKPIKSKVIDIYYDITCSCQIRASQIEEAGEKVLGAILELEAQGYRFNLYHIDTYADCRDVDILAIKIKDASQPLDLKRMSFMLMHPASFRIVGFDWYSKCPVTQYKSAYGRALVHDAGDSKADRIIKHIFGSNAVIFQASRIINNSYTQEHLKEVLTNAKHD